MHFKSSLDGLLVVWATIYDNEFSKKVTKIT